MYEASTIQRKQRKQHSKLRKKPINQSTGSNELQKSNEHPLRYTIVLSGLFFLLFIIIVAIVIPEPKRFQFFVFRTTLSIAASLIGIMIPGMFEIQINWLKNVIKGSGAVVFFLCVYLITPQFLDEPPKEINAASAFAIGYYNHFLLPLAIDCNSSPILRYDDSNQIAQFKRPKTGNTKIKVVLPSSLTDFSHESLKDFKEKNNYIFGVVYSKEESRPLTVHIPMTIRQTNEVDNIEFVDFPRTLISIKEIVAEKLEKPLDEIDYKSDEWLKADKAELEEFVSILTNKINSNAVTRDRVQIVRLDDLRIYQ